jgi:hypothetical protein
MSSSFDVVHNACVAGAGFVILSIRHAGPAIAATLL